MKIKGKKILKNMAEGLLSIANNAPLVSARNALN